MTSTTDHTPGLLCEPTDGSVGTIMSWETGLQVAQAQQITSYREDPQQSERRANTRHIIACWNACHGIPTQSLIDNGVASFEIFVEMRRTIEVQQRQIESYRIALKRAHTTLRNKTIKTK